MVGEPVAFAARVCVPAGFWAKRLEAARTRVSANLADVDTRVLSLGRLELLVIVRDALSSSPPGCKDCDYQIPGT